MTMSVGARSLSTALLLCAAAAVAATAQQAFDVQATFNYVLLPGAEQLGPDGRQRVLRHVGRHHASDVAREVRLDLVLRSRRPHRRSRLRPVPLGKMAFSYLVSYIIR